MAGKQHHEFLLGLFSVFCLLLAGCATTADRLPPPSLSGKKGVYHKVLKGETLWRIAQTYRVNVEDIVAANHIPGGARLDEGQLVMIPGAEEVQAVSPPAADGGRDEFVWPLKGNIRHYFGERRSGVPYKGIEIEASEGTPVKAALPGRVIFADYLVGYAYTVIVDHRDGFSSVYAHNGRLLVKLGAQVSAGEAIAEVGQNGRLASLYLEIRKNGQASDPLHYLPKL